MSEPRFTYMPSTRWYMGEVTEAAKAFANGDDDRLAGVALAKLLDEQGITFDWSPENPRDFVVGGYFAIRAKGVRMKNGSLDFEPAPEKDGDWIFYANVEIENTVVLMGAAWVRDNPLSCMRLLSTMEWLRGVGAGHPHAELEGAVV